MSNQFESIVLMAEDNIIFEMQNKENTLVIKAFSLVSNSYYSNRYKEPYIPDDFEYIEGRWDSGVVIENKETKSQYVWVPVSSLRSNGTIDGINFCEKFGRRNFQNDKFSKCDFFEEMTDELKAQMESVKKYGGFYVSRFNISRDQSGKLLSIKGAEPLVALDYDQVVEASRTVECSENVTSHLVYGAEYDSLIEWLIESGVRPKDDFVKNSNKIGNYWNSDFSPKGVLETGASEAWRINNMYDIAGNINEWTKEIFGETGNEKHVARGGCAYHNGADHPAVYRKYQHFVGFVGFRVCLCLK